MAHHDPDIINRATRPEDGYEKRDIDFPKVGKATFIFFAFTVLMIFLTVPMFTLLVHGSIDPRTINTPIRTMKPIDLPPAPNPIVQTNTSTKRDIYDLRRNDAAKTGSYGYVDKEKGVVHIPVEEAMKRVAERGLEAPATP